MRVWSCLSCLMLILTCGWTSPVPIKEVQGPTDDVDGYQLTEKDWSMPIALGDKGTLSFWFKTDQTYGGQASFPNVKIPMITAGKLFSIRLQTAQGRAMLIWQWGKDAQGSKGLNIQIPSLAGPAWYHVYYQWDADKGIFTGYLNGTPLRLEGTVFEPWKMGSAENVTLHQSPFAYGPVSSAKTLQPFDPDNEFDIPAKYRGNMDDMLGAKFKPTVDIAARQGKELFNFPLTDASQTKDWVLEGPGDIQFDKQGMIMSSTLESGQNLDGHIVYWMPHDLPENFTAQWVMQPISEDGLCITFFAAKGVKGEDLFDPSLKKRDGVFKQYINSDINSYHFSYYANTPFNPGRITTNLRKNSGFRLISNGAPGITPGSTDAHQVMMLKDGGRIVVNVDGKTILDYTDDGQKDGPIHGGGKFGLRQMRWMKALYRDLKIYSLK